MENRFNFKVKAGYISQILTPETMELLWSKEKKNQDKNGQDCTSFRYYWSTVSSL